MWLIVFILGNHEGINYNNKSVYSKYMKYQLSFSNHFVVIYMKLTPQCKPNILKGGLINVHNNVHLKQHYLL